MKIYSGLLPLFILLLLFYTLLLSWQYTVRIKRYQRQMMAGSLSVVVTLLKQTPAKNYGQRLRQINQILGFPMQLAYHALGKKGRADPLQGYLAQNRQLFQFAPGYYLIAPLGMLSETNLAGTGELMREALTKVPQSMRNNFLQSMQRHFYYPIFIRRIQHLHGLSPHQKKALKRHQGIILLKAGSMKNFTPLKDGALQLGPVPFFEPFPFWLVCFITLCLFLLASIVAQYLIRDAKRRLQELATIAVNFAQGSLDTRISVKGSDALAQLGQSFNLMADNTKRLLAIQRDMVQGVSHELRTPAARLRFGLAMLSEVQTEKERDRYLKEMDRDIEELDALVDEILTFASLERGLPEMRFKAANIDEICSQVAKESAHHSVEVIYSGREMASKLHFAEVHKRYIYRAISNLVTNACRHADRKVLITFSSSQETCRVDVDDDGQGIAPGHWEQIFNAFTRIDESRTKATGGYGLGLSIVRQIMRWHKGQALVTSSRLGGARFSLIWPRRRLSTRLLTKDISK